MSHDPFDPHCGTPPRIPGYEDGYPNCNGAAETPSDSIDLDPMLFPDRKEPILIPLGMEETFEQWEARKMAAEEAHERDEYWKSRCFELDPATAMGENLSPSRKRTY